jgi:hypothetical protein
MENDETTNQIVEIVADVLPWLRALQARLIKGRNVAFIEYADELQAGLKPQDFLQLLKFQVP